MERGLPARTDEGRLPSATVNVSSSASESWFVAIVPVPVVRPPLIVIDESVPWSPDSDVLRVTVSGIVTPPGNAADNLAVTVTEEPSSTGFGEADRLTNGGGTSSSSSAILTGTEDGLPARTDEGRLPSATVNVSSSVSVSWFVAIIPVPVVWSPLIVIDESVPWSPDSDVFRVTVSGIVTAPGSTADNLAVTVTEEPSSTGFGEADSDTVGVGGVVPPSSSRILTVTEDGLPARTDEGRLPSATVNVSSSVSASSLVVIVPVPVAEPPAIVMLASAPKSPDSAVPAVTATGIVTAFDSAADNLAVTVTDEPSSTGFGEADSDTVGVGGVVPPSSSNRQVHCAVTAGVSLSLYSNPLKPA